MTAINKQITFRLAPFPPFWAWYPAKFAAPKMKVCRRQHCIIVNAVKCGEVERESERRKGIRATVSFGACRFRQWRDKTKAKSGQNFWRADLQGYNNLAKPTWGSGNYYMHWYGIREHRVLRRPRPAPTPLPVQGLGHFVTLYVPTLPFRSTWKFVPWHEFEPATLLRLRHYGHGGYSSSQVRVAGCLAGNRCQAEHVGFKCLLLQRPSRPG